MIAAERAVVAKPQGLEKPPGIDGRLMDGMLMGGTLMDGAPLGADAEPLALPLGKPLGPLLPGNAAPLKHTFHLPPSLTTGNGAVAGAP